MVSDKSLKIWVEGVIISHVFPPVHLRKVPFHGVSTQLPGAAYHWAHRLACGAGRKLLI